jgi:hypothetical protein
MRISRQVCKQVAVMQLFVRSKEDRILAQREFQQVMVLAISI